MVKSACDYSDKKIKALEIQELLKFGGGRWIRTIEVSDNRFTVCPLWPTREPLHIKLFTMVPGHYPDT